MFLLIGVWWLIYFVFWSHLIMCWWWSFRQTSAAHKDHEELRPTLRAIRTRSQRKLRNRRWSRWTRKAPFGNGFAGGKLNGYQGCWVDIWHFGVLFCLGLSIHTMGFGLGTFRFPIPPTPSFGEGCKKMTCGLGSQSGFTFFCGDLGVLPVSKI